LVGNGTTEEEALDEAGELATTTTSTPFDMRSSLGFYRILAVNTSPIGMPVFSADVISWYCYCFIIKGSVFQRWPVYKCYLMLSRY
jgi:hypothetical protein